MNKEKLVSLLENGCNCSQTVLSYFAEHYGLEGQQAKRIAEPFESGLFSGGICGAVLGAYMVLGLAFGSDEKNHRTAMKAKTETFNRLFIGAAGSLQCKELLGCDISDDSVLQTALENGTIQKICPAAIGSAIRILEEEFCCG